MLSISRHRTGHPHLDSTPATRETPAAVSSRGCMARQEGLYKEGTVIALGSSATCSNGGSFWQGVYSPHDRTIKGGKGRPSLCQTEQRVSLRPTMVEDISPQVEWLQLLTVSGTSSP